MQLTCPNCAARYLVDPAAIGPSGRTVQCFRCGHKWQERGSSAPSIAQPVPPPAPTAAPDFVIRPQNHAAPSALPAIPVDPGLPVWLKAVIGVLVILALLGGGSYLFREQVIPVLVVDQGTTKIDRRAEEDGKTVYVVTGDIINTGVSDAAARRLHLTILDANGNRIEERAVEIATGPIPPNGRGKFEARIGELPTTSAQVDLAAE
jgi:predicted Zn finger-like uncharacterized protein